MNVMFALNAFYFFREIKEAKGLLTFTEEQ